MKQLRKNGRRPPNLAIIRALIATAEAEALLNGGRFIIDGYELKKVENSSNWYVFRYDPGLGYAKKASLGTSDVDEAKVMIAHLVAEQPELLFADQDDLPVDVAVELYLLSDPKRDISWASASGSLLRGLEQALPGVMIGAFTKNKQKALIAALATGPSGRPLMPGSISNCMTLAQAAIRAACNPDEDGRRLCTVVPFPMIVMPGAVASVLGVAPPKPRNWHATIEELAAFLVLIQDDEPLRQWMLLSIALVCRGDVAATATAEQIDRRIGVFHLNPAGRAQARTKYRPSLPLPPSVLAEITCWDEGAWVNAELAAIRSRFTAAGKRLGLGPDFVPSSMRDFGATMLREAYVRYGTPLVPDQQVMMWMGHRHKSVNHLYGRFQPDYLLLARNAIECVVRELDDRSGGVLLRNARAAGTLPPVPVVIDPADLRGSGVYRFTGTSANPAKLKASNDDAEWAKVSVGCIPQSSGMGLKTGGDAVVIGSNRAKTGGVGTLEGQFSQVQASPGWAQEAPNGIAARLIAQGFKIVEFWPEGNEDGESSLYVIGKSAKLLSDQDGRRVCTESSTRPRRGRKITSRYTRINI